MSALVLAIALAGASSPTQATEVMLRTYVSCAARRGEAQMHAMLDAWDEGSYRTAAQSFSGDPRCAVNDDVTTTVLASSFNEDRGKLRGMVAENLVKRSRTVTNLTPLPKAATYSAVWTGLTSRLPAIDEMAMCVAATDPAGVLALIATNPNSAAQNRAFTALTPSLGACLAKGYQLDTKPTALRAALAEALYHRDTASAGGSVKGS